MMVSLSLPFLIGGAGFGVETSYWYLKSLELQGAADNAAYAAALDKRSGSNDTAVRATAANTAAANGFDASVGTITVNTPPASGPNRNAQSVEVLLNQNQDRFFSSLFTNAPLVAKARAVATFQSAANACVLALNATASKAVDFSGNTSTTLTSCSVMSNSTAADSINVQGSAQATAACFVSAGGVTMTSGGKSTQCAQPIRQAPPAGDPYAAFEPPAASGNCRNSNGATLQAGRYCSGLTLSGTVTLNPGVYYVSGGDFRINANANVTGTGVTIVLVGSARVTMNGNAMVRLSAPTSGATKGMLFYGDRASSGGTNRFNGTAASLLTGTIYAPRQDVAYLGNFSGSGGCTQVVASTVTWSGSTTIAVDCSAYGMSQVPILQVVKVVE
ncbi:MAG: hypothetical protein KJS97_00705 [Alphaproteobacteria bacterium]|nr:hypothetical protein [Alphaproteobacteria bacterium]